MAGDTPYRSVDSPTTSASTEANSFWSDCWKMVVMVLKPLASLKITVVLFLMAIFIVFAGTLAQTEKDIWEVVHQYFRMDLHSVARRLGLGIRLDRFSHFLPAVLFPQHGTDPLGLRFLLSQWVAYRAGDVH